MKLIIIYSFLISVFFLGCSNQSEGLTCICTTEFREIRVLVLDNKNNPVRNAKATATVLSSNYQINSTDDLYFPGYYIVATDEIVNKMLKIEKVLFKCVLDTSSVSAEYFIATDNCRCHVTKISGPDTLKLNIN